MDIEVRPRKRSQSKRDVDVDGDHDVVTEDKWYFESFVHCLMFHQFQLNHGGSHLLLKAMHLERVRLEMLKQKEDHILKQRALWQKERKLHSFYTKIVNSMQRNHKELEQCKQRIFSEHKKFLDHIKGSEAKSSKELTVPGLPTRTSALDLAKQALSGKSRRTSVLVRNPNPMGIVRETEDDRNGNSSEETHLTVP